MPRTLWLSSRIPEPCRGGDHDRRGGRQLVLREQLAFRHHQGDVGGRDVVERLDVLFEAAREGALQAYAAFEVGNREPAEVEHRKRVGPGGDEVFVEQDAAQPACTVLIGHEYAVVGADLVFRPFLVEPTGDAAQQCFGFDGARPTGSASARVRL